MGTRYIYDLDAAQHFLADHAADLIVTFNHHAHDWVKRMPQLHNLIRIRGATIQALCTWDLDGRRPPDLVVLNSARDLTGMTRQEVLEAGAAKGCFHADRLGIVT